MNSLKRERATVETLRRQVKEEMHTKSVLVARINSDSTDMVKYKKDTEQKRDKASKVAKEVQTAVDAVEAKVDKLRNTKKEKTEAKEKIKQQLEETAKQKEESREKFMGKINDLEPHHKHLKDDVTKLEKRLDYMEWKTEQMNKQIGDMDREEVTMKKLVDNALKAIAELEERRD